MGEARPGSGDRLHPRRWVFASCVFDEANWSLTVDGQRVAVESKPLELLRALLLRAGNVLSKDELLDTIWPDVIVVEASLSTAVYKLRTALGDGERERCIVETVPGIGYRLAAPVALEQLPVAPDGSGAVIGATPVFHRQEIAGPAEAPPARQGRKRLLPLIPIAVVLLLAAGLIVYEFFPIRPAQATARPFSPPEVIGAVRRLDVDRIDAMLKAGWNPNAPLDDQDNGAINYALNICEWDRGHDRRRLLLMVRTLFDGGARLDHRNSWGDTPYSIAKAERYCGPAHPVTQMIQTLCNSPQNPLGDRCLASYEIARRTGAAIIPPTATQNGPRTVPPAPAAASPSR